jgi:hypothetical protein
MENATMDGNLPFLDEKDDDLNAAPEPPQVEPKGEPEAAPPAAVVEEKHQSIPISALLDEREKRQQAAREADDLRRQLAEYEAAKAQPKPDFYADPEAFIAKQQQAVQQALWNERLNTSEILARRAHGDDVVAAAAEAFKAAAGASPALASEFSAQPDPYGFVINWHKRQSILSQIGDNPDAYRARIEQEVRERLLAEMQPATPAPKAPPPSMAAVPATGNSKPPPASGFDALFKSD